MSARTIFLSKLLGLLLVVVALSMLIQGPLIAETAAGIVRDRPLSFIVGIFTLACGLAMVLVHNRWSSGALPVVVTVLGWITLIKGAIFVLLPPQMLISLFETIQIGRLIYLYAAIDLAIGLYLTIAGFMVSPRMD
jgi:vacuolar-type H+-ATPase subunit I/STV1